MQPIKNPHVAAVFDGYPEAVKAKLLQLRQLIFDTAAETEGVGELEETLKWGQPAYLTSRSGSGTTLRIDRIKACDDQFAIFVHCQTNLIDRFRSRFPQTFHFEGNRAIVFNTNDALPINELRVCIAMALTYHQSKPPGQKRANQA